MAKRKKSSVAPIYTIAVIWVLYTLLHSLCQTADYVTVILLSAVGFIIAKGIWPTKVYDLPDLQVEEEKKEPEEAKPAEEEKKSTGNPKLDALIEERDKAISEMRRLNDAIPDESVSAQIDDLEETTRKIIDHVVEHPEKLPQIRKFMNYYLPTTLKILNAYDRMGAAGVSGENIDGTMEKIELMMDTTVASFHKQLDALFRDEAMDISSDITVMENMLAREGLGGIKMGEVSGEPAPQEKKPEEPSPAEEKPGEPAQQEAPVQGVVSQGAAYQTAPTQEGEAQKEQ